MRKIWTIACKDTVIRLRDRNLTLLALLAPLIIAGVMGLALSGAGAESHPISVVVINQDEGLFGKIFEAAIADTKSGVALKLSPAQDLARARETVERGETQALVYVPRDFSASLQSAGGAGAAAPVVQVYCGEDAAAKADAIRSVCDQAARRLRALIVGKQIAAARLQIGAAQDARASQLDAAFAQEISARQVLKEAARIELKTSFKGDVKIRRNPFTFFAPSIGVFFLMICMIEAPRSILSEREGGTLGRLLSTPIKLSQLLLGKLGGSCITGILQFAMLIVASRLIFGLTWGDSLSGLALMVAAVVVASTGMGAVIAAFSKNFLQAGVIGGGIALISAGLGGNFFATDNLSVWLQVLSRLTINRWALEGFSKLVAHNLEARDVLLNAGVLFGMAACLFALALWKFQRRIAE
jgi:linearmycin/streptolysin S transport system permease protein